MSRAPLEVQEMNKRPRRPKRLMNPRVTLRAQTFKDKKKERARTWARQRSTED